MWQWLDWQPFTQAWRRYTFGKSVLGTYTKVQVWPQPISSPKSDMPASEPFISKETIEHSLNWEFLLKIYNFLSFWKSLSSTKLTYTQTLSAIYALTLVLMRTSRKTHFRLWANLEITLVTMTYHKSMTGSVPLCPLMFSWRVPLPPPLFSRFTYL